MNEPEKKLSIIVPYYNGEKWVAKCLDSLLNQDISSFDYEIIVVNDGSTDSIDVLQAYASKYDNIQYVYQKNAYQCAARNNGLQHAKGEYVMFCDVDDYVHPHVLGTLINAVMDNDLDVLFYNFQRTQGDGIADNLGSGQVKVYETGRLYLESIEGYAQTYPWDFIVKTNVLLENNIKFPTDFVCFEDDMLYFNLLSVAGRVGHIDKLVYYYYFNPLSVTHNLRKINNSEKYVSNIYEVISFLTKFDGGNSALRFRDFRTFVLLHNSLRYCKLGTTFRYLPMLESIGAYPMKTELLTNNKANKIIKNMMNIKYLWYLISIIYHLVPSNIRKKY